MLVCEHLPALLTVVGTRPLLWPLGSFSPGFTCHSDLGGHLSGWQDVRGLVVTCVRLWVSEKQNPLPEALRFQVYLLL